MRGRPYPDLLPGVSIRWECLFWVLFFFPAISGLSYGAPPSGGRPPSVAVRPVTEEDVNPPIEYVGYVEAVQSVDLRARVEGYLEQVAFTEGANVKAGDLLFQIEQAPYKVKVNIARAKVSEAEASLTQARQYLNRLQTVRSGGISATDMDAAVSTELQTKARLQEAVASLEQAELDLGYTIIRSPIAGRIGRAAFTQGNLVGPDSGALARIVQMNPIRVVYSMSESDLLAVHKTRSGKSEVKGECPFIPRIMLSGGDSYPTPGRMDFIDNQVDAGTGTIAVRAVFDNSEGVLIPGRYVTVLLRCKDAKRLPVAPQASVQEDREGRFVFVVDVEKRVEKRRITTGPLIGDGWAVTEGLSAGEILIVQGVQKVQPGQVVETVADGMKQ